MDYFILVVCCLFCAFIGRAIGAKKDDIQWILSDRGKSPCPTCSPQLKGHPNLCPSCQTIMRWDGNRCEYFPFSASVFAAEIWTAKKLPARPLTLGKCRQCNNSVSRKRILDALSCPHCGEPNPANLQR